VATLVLITTDLNAEKISRCVGMIKKKSNHFSEFNIMQADDNVKKNHQKKYLLTY